MADTQYVFIESRDPFESGDTGFVGDAAAALRERGRPVTVFLVQNAVLAVRAGARGSQIPRLAGAGVAVLADEFSLRERGIEGGEIAAGVREASIDAPYEAAASTTAFRIIAAALRKGINVNVFAYEGAVSLTMKDQTPHANPVKGTTVEEEEHPTTKDLVAALIEFGKTDPKLTWINCGLCVDERGAGHWIDGVKRGSPADFLTMALESNTTLVIPTK